MWQFTRATGKEFLRIDYIIDERRDPLISARAAAAFLKRNHTKLGTWPLALTAYNYGPAGTKRALAQEGSYEQIFLKYRKGHFKFASRNFYSEFLAAVKVAKQLERSGLNLARPARYVAVKLPAFTDAGRLCSYLGIDKDELRRYNPALRDPVFQGTKYIPAEYVIRLPERFKGNNRLASAPASLFKSAQKRSKFYQVRSGDTAGAIALAHRVSLKDLIRVNNLNNQAMIRVGQNLRIPPANGKSISSSRSQKVLEAPLTLTDKKKTTGAEPTYGLQPLPADNVVVGNLKVFDIRKKNQLVSGSVVVHPDESVGLFADWLKVTRQSIHALNSLPLSRDIHPGQQIVLDFLSTSIEDFEETRFDFHQEIQEDFFSSYAVIGLKSYQVKDGDTIWDICYNKFGIPLWLLQKYNDQLDLNHLDTSSSLQIPILQQI
jgi:membrane-bound lytic murein transglycosylase D